MSSTSTYPLPRQQAPDLELPLAGGETFRLAKDEEPDVFNEPAMFLIRPDGTVYYESILSMPVGRPQVDELLQGIDFWSENDYPARGEA